MDELKEKEEPVQRKKPTSVCPPSGNVSRSIVKPLKRLRHPHLRRRQRRTVLLILTAVILVAAASSIFIGTRHAAVRKNAATASQEKAEARNRKSLSASSVPTKTVVIDPGHGGPDPGAIGSGGVYEKTLNLEIGLKLRDAFQKAGYTVIMTRSDDRSIYDAGSTTLAEKKNSDLNNRVKIIQSHPNAFFISIHQNYSENSLYSGTQVYYSANTPGSLTLAKLIQSQIKKDLEPANKRRIHTQDDLRVLKQAHIPAVLVECGFISNAAEAASLENDGYQNKLAASIETAANTFYRQSKTSSGSP